MSGDAADLDAAMQEAARLFGMGAIECPGCGETKYVGHGPLCLTCYTAPRSEHE